MRVLDTSAILNGTWTGPGTGCLAPPAVEDEISPGGRDHARWERLIASGLRIEEPSPETRRMVEAQARDLGESRLSTADRDVAALALGLKARGGAVRVVTDDYALQNVLASLDVAWESARERGIREVRRYALRCSGCGRWFHGEAGLAEEDACPVCGSPVRRKRT